MSIAKYSKAQTLLVTVVFKFENTTCLSANVLIEKPNFKKSNHIQDIINNIKNILDNDLVTVDEHHAD